MAEWVKSQAPSQHESRRLITDSGGVIASIVCRQDHWAIASPGVTQRLLATGLEAAQREAVRLIRADAQGILDATAPATPGEGES
jgi:hypothetical protein